MKTEFCRLAEKEETPYVILSEDFKIIHISCGARAMAGDDDIECLTQADLFQGNLRALMKEGKEVAVRLPFSRRLDCCVLLQRDDKPCIILILFVKDFHLSEQDLGVVSHDFKGPVATIMSCAQLLLKNKTLSEREGTYIDSIIGNCCVLMRISNTLEDLLVLTNDACGQQFQVMDGLFLAESMMEMFPEQMAGFDVILRFEKEGNAAPIRCQPILLERALINLVTNAIKFAATEIIVTASVRGNTLEIAVADNGIGISIEKQDKVFELFYSTEAPKTRHTGCGIGLHLVNLVVRGHGGKVTLKSKPHFGSKFCMIIPLCEESEQDGLLLKSPFHTNENQYLTTALSALRYEMIQKAKTEQKFLYSYRN